MQLQSVNIGKSLTIEYPSKTETTGIYKNPTEQPVQIHTLGLEGDAVVDEYNHGGVDQAVYVYGSADYAWWSEQLGHELEPGTFGDNLTITGLASAGLNVGDKIHVGEVTLQVTAARIPCKTLARRMDDPQFVKKFRHGGRPGVYCRVLKTGTVRAGDPVHIEAYEGDTISIGEMFSLYYESEVSENDLQRQLAAPVAVRARRDLEEKLAKIKA